MTNYNINRDVRDSDIRQALEARRADDTKIMQKVNAVNRVAFTERFPEQIEHHMRLVSERLQACLIKPEGIELSDPNTWPATVGEIHSLCSSLASLESVRQNWPRRAVEQVK